MPKGYRLDRDDRGLTSRERQVLQLMVLGKGQTEIGKELGLSKQRIDQLVKALIVKGVVSADGETVLVRRR